MNCCVNFTLSTALNVGSYKQGRERVREREAKKAEQEKSYSMKNILSAIHKRQRLEEQALVVFSLSLALFLAIE